MGARIGSAVTSFPIDPRMLCILAGTLARPGMTPTAPCVKIVYDVVASVGVAQRRQAQ